MTVRVDYDKDMCQLVVHVACNDVSSDRELNNTFNDLDTALGKIEEKLDSDIPFFLINLEAKGVSSSLGEFDPFDDGGEDYHLGTHNPWKVFCPPFWTKASGAPHLRQRVKDWIVRIEKI